MPSLLDELVISLKLDVEGLRADMRKVESEVKRGSEEIASRTAPLEKAASGASEAVKGIRNEFLALFGVVLSVEGFKRFIETITDSSVKLGNLARQIGVSTQQIRGMEGAAESLGGTAGGVDRALAILSQAFQDVTLRGGSDTANALRALGVQFNVTADGAFNTADAVRRVLDQMRDFDPQRQAGIGRILGWDPDTTTAMLSTTGAELDKLIEKFAKLHDPKVIESAHHLHSALTLLKAEATSLGEQIYIKLEPAITSAVKAMSDWIDKNKDWLAQEVKERIEQIIPVVLEIVKAISSVVDFLGGWKTTTEVIFGLWVASKVAPMITAIASVAAAFGTANLAASGMLATMLKLAPLLGLLGTGPAGAEMSNEERERVDREFRQRTGRGPRPPGVPLFDSTGSPIPGTYGGAQRQSGSGGVMPGGVTLIGGGSQGAPYSPNADATANNPGALTYTGAPGEMAPHGNSRWARYATIEEGIAGNVKQLMIYQDKYKLKSVSQMINRWAPPEENDTAAYIASVSRALGVGKDDPVDIRDPKVAQEMMRAISEVEKRNKLTPDQIARGTSLALGTGGSAPSATARNPWIPGSIGDPAFLGVGASVAAGRHYNQTTTTANNTNSSNVHVAQVVINTPATDTNGIAKGIGNALRRYSHTPQANSGLA